MFCVPFVSLKLPSTRNGRSLRGCSFDDKIIGFFACVTSDFDEYFTISSDLTTTLIAGNIVATRKWRNTKSRMKEWPKRSRKILFVHGRGQGWCPSIIICFLFQVSFLFVLPSGWMRETLLFRKKKHKTERLLGNLSHSNGSTNSHTLIHTLEVHLKPSLHHHQLSTTHILRFRFSSLLLACDQLHTDTYRFSRTPRALLLRWFTSRAERIFVSGWDPVGWLLMRFSLTWICTHELIFVQIGCLSAACVLNMSTHSFSGAKHNRQQALPATWAIIDTVELPIDFFFFSDELSWSDRKDCFVSFFLDTRQIADDSVDADLEDFLAMVFFLRERILWMSERERETSPLRKVSKLKLFCYKHTSLWRCVL